MGREDLETTRLLEIFVEPSMTADKPSGTLYLPGRIIRLSWLIRVISQPIRKTKFHLTSLCLFDVFVRIIQQIFAKRVNGKKIMSP